MRNLINSRIVEGIIKTTERMTYEDVAKIYPAWLYVEDESVVVSDKVYDGSTDADVTAIIARLNAQ